MTVGKVHNLLLCDALDTFLGLNQLLPRCAVDKCIGIHADTLLVTLKVIIVAQLQIVDNGGQQVVAELALLQFIDLAEQQLAHLVKCLTVTRRSQEDEHRVVEHRHVPSVGLKHLHLLVDIEVEESGSTVV